VDVNDFIETIRTCILFEKKLILDMRKSYLILLVALASCNAPVQQAYLDEIADFRVARVDYLKSEEGYVNLSGLYWVKEGKHNFGSDNDNDIQFPAKAEQLMGTITRQGDSLFMEPAPAVTITIDNEAITGNKLFFVPDTLQTMASFGSLRWFGIKRGEDIGIRLRDFKNPLLAQLTSIPSYPTDPKWRLEAQWEQYDEPKILKLPNQVGQIIETEAVGAFHFEVDGEPYSLEPIGEAHNGEYFLMIYDQTSGQETYGSGRYMYIPVPDKDGLAIIDFNKAFNPPCVFTEYATCLFPHEANRLPFKIEAGEKYPEY
jgi:uncharacterized protein (DUF1684 family)